MNSLRLFAAFIAPSLQLIAEPGTDAAWLQQKQQEREAIISEWHKHIDSIPHHLQEFEANEMLEAPITSTDMPVREAGKTVAVSDGGMLFDASGSCITYVRNVRLHDARLRLRVANSLILQLTKGELKGAADRSAAQTGSPQERVIVQNKAETTQPAPRAEGLTAETAQPIAQSGHDETVAHNLTPTEEANKPLTEEQAAKAQQESEQFIPYDVSAPNALADAEHNRILLTTHGGEGPITIQHATDFLHVTSSPDLSASILADEFGDIYIHGRSLHLKWTDADGQPCELRAQSGRAYYNAERKKLYVEGKCHLTQAQGTLQCEDGMMLELHVTQSNNRTDKEAFMGQFAGLEILGINGAVAKGQVILHTQATEEHPAGEAHGDVLTYNGKTGESLLTGQQCLLVYGNNRVQALNGAGIQLAENGEIYLRGSEICGNYERPSSRRDGGMIAGTFAARGTIVFRPAEGSKPGSISTEQGLSVRDAESDFTCTGPAQLLLQKETPNGSPKDRRKSGMLNLAVAEYKHIAGIEARGDVRLNHLMPQQRDTRPPSRSSMTGDYVKADLLEGTAFVSAKENETAALQRDDDSLTAVSEKAISTIELKPNGDIDVRGETIRTSMTAENGQTQAICKDFMHLDREAGILTSGRGTRVDAPDGIFTANGPLTILLAKDPTQAEPLHKSYPHLIYNFLGVRHISTAEGGTIRTAQGSMQSSGQMDIELDPTGKPSAKTDTAMGGIIRAEAKGDVAVVGKNTDGELIQATGDRLLADGRTGDKIITGSRVTLANRYNTHVASGKGAAVHVDRHNNARITGEKHSTSATNINKQVESKN